MSWLLSFFVGVLTCIVGAMAAGLVALGCVDWYRISPREGGSGYFVVFIGLIGGFFGFWIGLLTSRYFGGFWAGLGASAGGAIGIAGAIALVAWAMADVPPTINGRELDLVVEVRVAAKPAVIADKQYLVFESGNLRESGPLEVAKAVERDGQWVVPGSVHIATTSNPRTLIVVLDPDHGVGFRLQFPGNPGTKYAQWSDWITVPAMSYRFRIEERVPFVASNPFDALNADSPMEEWLGYYNPSAKNEAILTQMGNRPADVARILRSPTNFQYDHAMNAVAQLQTVDPVVTEAVRGAGKDMEDDIRRMKTGDADMGRSIMYRFSSWGPAWVHVAALTSSDVRPPVEAILKLASEKLASLNNDDGYIQNVAGNAQAMLNGAK